MYTRGPSIGSILQKAVLLKDTKCNKIIQRQLCSESLIKFSKIEKLLPMRRYYSGASINRNANQKNRSLQGVEYFRKAVPKFTREMVQQQHQPLSTNEQMAMRHIQNNQPIANNLGMPSNVQYLYAPITSGKITIVLDKNEICGCSASNENVQILVTATPEVSGTKCNCCQQCQELKGPGIQNMCSTSATTVPPFPQPSNKINFSNRFPIRLRNVHGLSFPRFEQNMYGLPERRFSWWDDRRPSNFKKSRSMSDFHVMRKFVVPNTTNESKLQARQAQVPPIDRTHSLSRVNDSSRFNNDHPTAFQRTMRPNQIHMQRSLSVHSQINQQGTPKVNPLPIQQNPGTVFPHHNQNTKPHPAEYSPFYQNGVPLMIPENIPINMPDAKQNKQQREKEQIGRSGPNVNQPVPKDRFIVERVIRPATFSPVGRIINNNAGSIAGALNQIAVNQIIKALTGPNAVKSSDVPFTSQPKRFNLHREVIAKNRFPAGKVIAPRTFTSRNRNGFDVPRRTDNDFLPGTGRMGYAGQANILSKNKVLLQPLSIPPKQRSTELISFINRSMVNPKHLSAGREPHLVVPKNRSEMRPLFNKNHHINKLQPQKIFYRQKSNHQFHHRLPMRAKHMNRMSQSKQPPLFLLKRRAPVLTAHRRRNRQPLQKRSRSFIPILRKGAVPSNVNSKQYGPQKQHTNGLTNFWNKVRPSMVPVRRVTQQLEGRRQQKPMESQKLRPKAARRVKRGQLQSSLPVVVPKKKNQIEKYPKKPKSVDTAGRPYQRRINPDRLQQMSPQPQATNRMAQQRVIQRNRRKPDYAEGPKITSPRVDMSKLNNPAVLFYGPGKLKLVDTPVPRLADETEVIVKMLYVHLTDTDAQMLSAEQNGPYKLSQPTIAGKSGSGVIVDAGKRVETVKIGDKVSVKGVSCGKCTACLNDNEVICERVSMTEKLGILKRFHAVPAQFVTKLPDSVHPIDGAMIDELSSAIRACKKSTVTAGDNVLVLGGKSLGLWTALAAKSMGATNVCLVDARPSMLNQAKNLGIEQVILIDPKSGIPNILNSIAKYMDGDNPRIVFDCNGSSLTNYIAINTSVVGGKVIFMKNAISNQPMFLANAVDRGVDILSSQHGNNDSERAALQFLSSGKVQLKGIDSSFFEITNVHEAFGLLNSGTTANIFVQPSRPDDESDGKK